MVPAFQHTYCLCNFRELPELPELPDLPDLPAEVDEDIVKSGAA